MIHNNMDKKEEIKDVIYENGNEMYYIEDNVLIYRVGNLEYNLLKITENTIEYFDIEGDVDYEENLNKVLCHEMISSVSYKGRTLEQLRYSISENCATYCTKEIIDILNMLSINAENTTSYLIVFKDRSFVFDTESLENIRVSGREISDLDKLTIREFLETISTAKLIYKVGHSHV